MSGLSMVVRSTSVRPFMWGITTSVINRSMGPRYSSQIRSASCPSAA